MQAAKLNSKFIGTKLCFCVGRWISGDYGRLGGAWISLALLRCCHFRSWKIKTTVLIQTNLAEWKVCMVGHYRKSPVMLNKSITVILRKTSPNKESELTVITVEETSGSQTQNNDGESSDMLGQLYNSETSSTLQVVPFLRANIPVLGVGIMLGLASRWIRARIRNSTSGSLRMPLL